jgi:hypothetical protein
MMVAPCGVLSIVIPTVLGSFGFGDARERASLRWSSGDVRVEGAASSGLGTGEGCESEGGLIDPGPGGGVDAGASGDSTGAVVVGASTTSFGGVTPGAGVGSAGGGGDAPRIGAWW